MSASVARKTPQRNGGRFSELPIVSDAEPAMNHVAAGFDMLRAGAQIVRAMRTAANELERELNRFSVTQIKYRDSIAAHERKVIVR